MSKLLELAERVEKAEGPDRELDAAIAPLMGLTVVDEGHPIGRMCYDDIGAAQLMPRYTASIDAAMTLVPPDRKPMLIQQPCGRWEAAMLTTGDDDRDVCITENCATPALGLTAAALRSLAAQ